MFEEFQCLKGCRESFPNPARRAAHETMCDGKRKCNRHNDCEAAEQRAKDKGLPELYGAGTPRVDHCYDSDCEDCFGK